MKYFDDDNDAPTVTVANGQTIAAQAVGDAAINVLDDKNNEVRLTLYEVLLVPQLSCNLLSLNRVIRKGDKPTGNNFHDGPHGATFTLRTGEQIPVRRDKNMYWLQVQREIQANTTTTITSTTATPTTISLQLAHARAGHLNHRDLKTMCDLVDGVQLDSKSIQLCEACMLNKSTRATVPKEADEHDINPSDRIHSDIIGRRGAATDSR